MSFLSNKQFQDSGYELHNSLAFYRNFAGLRVLNPDPTEAQLSFTRNTIATRVNEAGLIETVSASVPRFEFDPITRRCRGLLIEEGRTNLLTRSEEFDNAVWIKSATSTISPNTAVSPFGTITAEAIVESNDIITHGVYRASSQLGEVVFSIFAKANNRTWLHLQTDMTATLTDVWVNLTNGTIGNISIGTSASVIPFPDGWYRVSWAFTATRTNNLAVYSATNNNINAYGGTSNSQAIFIWGAQLEAGAFVTSYIPTTTASVTRAHDYCAVTGSEMNKLGYNVQEGTFYGDFISAGTTGAKFNVFSFSNFNLNFTSGISDGSNSGGVYFTDGWVAQAQLGVTLNTSSRRAMSYKLNEFNYSVGASTFQQDMTGSLTLSRPNLLLIGYNGQGTQGSWGVFSEVAYFNKALSPTTLRALTT